LLDTEGVQLKILRSLIKNIFLRLADFVSAALPLRKKKLLEPHSVYILMLKPLGLGDLMMLSPFIIKVVERFGSASIYLVTEYPKFIDFNSVEWVHPKFFFTHNRNDALVISPTLSWRHLRFVRQCGFLLGYFLSNRINSNFIDTFEKYDARHGHYFQRAEYLLEILGYERSSDNDYCYPSLISSQLDDFGLNDEYVCVSPYSNWKERQYPVESYSEVVAAISNYVQVVLIGGSDDAEYEMAESFQQESVLNLVGKTDIQQVVSILSNAKLFIGNDSGLSHMAFLADIPSLVVFGCVAGSQRIPLNSSLSKRIGVLGAGNECVYFPCYDGFNKPKCRNRDRYICLNAVSAGDVIRSALSALGYDICVE